MLTDFFRRRHVRKLLRQFLAAHIEATGFNDMMSGTDFLEAGRRDRSPAKRRVEILSKRVAACYGIDLSASPEEQVPAISRLLREARLMPDPAPGWTSESVAEDVLVYAYKDVSREYAETVKSMFRDSYDLPYLQS